MSAAKGEVPVVAIDGPGGAGKGTIARAVAGRLGWHLLDSGSLYRITAHAAGQKGIELTDSKAVAAVARSLDVRFVDAEDGVRVVAAGARDVRGVEQVEGLLAPLRGCDLRVGARRGRGVLGVGD